MYSVLCANNHDDVLEMGKCTDNTLQGQKNTLPDITPADIETPNYTLVEASAKSDSDNDLKGEVNNNTANFSAFKSFVLDELHKIKDKIYNLGVQNPDGSGFVENLIIKVLAEYINNHENLKSNNFLYNDFTYGNKNTLQQ